MASFFCQGLLFLSLTSAIFYTVQCFKMCGKTPCDDGYCCSEAEGLPKNCCCVTTPTSITRTCVGSNVRFPLWGVGLIGAGVIGVILVIVVCVIIIRQRRAAALPTYGKM